jgi:nucleoside-diphosphate-sugar epimerase
MLKNFLGALVKTGAAKQLKKIILVTGAKQYGVHLGRPKNPMVESDPWLRDSKWPPNFYYNQQDVLHEYCKTHSIAWVVTYPNDVIGFAQGNFMNLATSAGLYAAVSKELGQDLAFPGSETFYNSVNCFTESKLHARFCHWAALEPKADNQAFNAVNGDVESWQNLWPHLAKRYGLKVKPDQFAQPTGDDDIIMDKEPPVSVFETEAGLVGTIKPNKVERRINLTNWHKQPEVKEAWERLAEREGLEKAAFEKATWNFLNFVLGRNFPLVISMSKARKLGWTG